MARSSDSRVSQVAVPPDARALSTVARVDYEDAFLAEAEQAEKRTGEQWARAFLEDPPLKTRRTLRAGWFALGLQLGPTESERLVLGWEVRRRGPDFALLAARSALGMEGEVLVKRGENTLLVATFLQLENLLARVVWAGAQHGHRRAVQDLLARATR